MFFIYIVCFLHNIIPRLIKMIKTTNDFIHAFIEYKNRLVPGQSIDCVVFGFEQMQLKVL